MIARTWEYQRAQEQKRFRTLSLALQGVQLAIASSGAAYVKNPEAVQKAFQAFLDDLLEVGESPKPEGKWSLARLKVMYGSRWRDHLDQLREEDRDKV